MANYMPILLLAVAPTLFWSGSFCRRGSMAAAGMALLIVAYCFGHHFLSLDLGPVPLTLDRLLLAGLVLCHAVRLAAGLERPQAPVAADWLLLALVGLCSLSALVYAMPQTSSAASPAWRLVASYWMPFALYWSVRHSPFGEKQLRWVLTGLTLLGVYLAVTALAEVSGQWSYVFPRYIADPRLGIHFGRARGPQLASQSLGFVLAVCLFAAWLLRRRLNGPLLPILFATYPVMLAAIYFTYTRSAWLGAAAGLAAIVLTETRRSLRPLVITAGGVACLAVAVLAGDGILAFRRDTSAGDTRHSIFQRTAFAYVSWQMFLDRPILGAGFGNFTRAKLDYLADRRVDLPLDSIRTLEHHNTPLSVLTETGLVGLAVYAALLAMWSVAAWRLCRNTRETDPGRLVGLLMLGTLVAYAATALFHDFTLTPSDPLFLFFLAAITIRLSAAGGFEREEVTCG